MSLVIPHVSFEPLLGYRFGAWFQGFILLAPQDLMICAGGTVVAAQYTTATTELVEDWEPSWHSCPQMCWLEGVIQLNLSSSDQPGRGRGW